MEPNSRVMRRRGATHDPATNSTPRRSVSDDMIMNDSEISQKIAYDPKDISERSERERLPQMTLMEEVVLLGLKDKQGYISFWNDTISYTLRACLMMELALRGRIGASKDTRQATGDFADRIFVEVVDDTLTGEALLDEALKKLKLREEKANVRDWIDMLSGETWSLLTADYQLKQVRERVAKSLTDKGVLRTGKSNFLIFDLTTHPLVDAAAKGDLIKRVRQMLMTRTVTLPSSRFFSDTLEFRYLRTVLLVCAAHSANVLETAFNPLSESVQHDAVDRVEGLLQDYAQWPFRQSDSKFPTGVNIGSTISAEVAANPNKTAQFQIVAACVDVLLKSESIL